MSLLRSTAVVGSLTMVSRVLGFARDQLMAAALGAGPIADAFVVAFRFPNLFRRIFAEGAFNSAFVPLYARRLEGEGEEAAHRFASETASFLATTLAILVVASQLAMPWLMYGLAPGYIDEPGWMSRTVLLTQITMPYLLFIALMAMLSGILNAHGRFAAAAGAPILLNIVLVGVLLARPEDPERTALHLAIGVAVSGVLQMLVVFWACRRAGVRFTLRPPRLTPGVRRLIALGVPGALSAGVTQINITVSQMVATLEQGANALLYYADRLYQLPLGMIGIAMGVALLPALSRRLRADDEEGARDSMNRAIEIAAVFTLPAAAALAVAPDFWVKGLFEHGAFTAENTVKTGQALMAFAYGLPAFVAAKVFAPGFFARENTRTPMAFAAISAVANIVLGVALFFTIGFVGLAIATALAGWINAGLLGRRLLRDGLLVLDDRARARLPRILAASLVMGAVVFVLAHFARAYMDQAFIADLGIILAVAVAGMSVYAVAALIFGGVKIGDLRASMRRSG